MQDEVLNYGFDANTYRSRVKIWLNDAQAEIARKVTIPELLVTTTINVVSGTATYTKPTDLVRVKGLIDPNFGWKLSIEEYDDLLLWNMGGQVTGAPESYAIGSNIILYPTPNVPNILTLMYYKDPVDLSANDDVSILPLDWHKTMIRYAVAEAYIAEDDSQMHGYHFGRYQEALRGLGEDRQFVGDGPRQVKGMWNI
jgi:hypothetical protein